MDEREWLVEHFQEHRPHLRAVAYRMLGSLAEADEAVQDSWLRVSRAGAEGIENFRGWLTTIVARGVFERIASAEGAARGLLRRAPARIPSSGAPASSTPSTRCCWPTLLASR